MEAEYYYISGVSPFYNFAEEHLEYVEPGRNVDVGSGANNPHHIRNPGDYKERADAHDC